MKKLSLLALAAAGLLMVGCSEKDTDENNTSQQGTEQFTDGAFIGVTLQLPSAQANTTRANEDFDDGQSDEFTVHNATLVIFKGANEDAATFAGEYVIGTGTDWETDGAANVTSTYSKATKISNELAAEMYTNANNDEINYYAYVIVNNPGVGTPSTGTTFENYRYVDWDLIGTPIAEEENIGDNGLLMTNAPVCEDQGGSQAAPTTAAKYSTLVKLDKNKVYANEANAVNNPAGCVFIERAAAKITVEVASGVSKVGTATDAPTIAFEEWQIINFPSTFYNTRKVNPAWGNLVSYITALDAQGNSDITTADFSTWNAENQYRFVSGTAFAPQKPSAHTGPFRTYFAEDKTYTTNGGLNRPQALPDHWIHMNKRGFTVENTFDVAHQTWKNTTMVTFKAKINGGANFYTVNSGDEMFLATTEPDKTAEQNVGAYVAAQISKLSSVITALKTATDELVAADITAYQTANPSATTTPTYEYGATVSVTLSAPSASSDDVSYSVSYAITGKNTDSKKSEADLGSSTASAITTALNGAKSSFKVNYHKGGIAYYNARIQHFGEYETPWSATKPFQTVAPGSTVAQIYGVGATSDLSADRFLGRYGVVRDNWYKLKINAVSHIGSAEPVNVSSAGNGDTPDDQIENYISVHVHIVPWVIRNQSISF